MSVDRLPAAFGLRAARLALLLTALGAGQAQAGLFDDDEARRQLSDFKAKMEARLDTQAKAQLELQGQIQRQSEELARLRGQIETLTYDLETAQKRQQDFYVDLDARLRKLETQAAGNAAASADKAAEAAKPAADPAAENRDYDAAINLMKASKFKDATTAFADFVQKYPDSSLAPNAQFWLGNAWYAQRDCRKAIEAQSYVASKWPDSPKAPDSLLAIATCQQELHNSSGARRTLEALLAKYPETPAAESAKQRLKKK